MTIIEKIIGAHSNQKVVRPDDMWMYSLTPGLPVTSEGQMW